MVDLQGYLILVVETVDGHIKLLGELSFHNLYLYFISYFRGVELDVMYTCHCFEQTLHR